MLFFNAFCRVITKKIGYGFAILQIFLNFPLYLHWYSANFTFCPCTLWCKRILTGLILPKRTTYVSVGTFRGKIFCLAKIVIFETLAEFEQKVFGLPTETFGSVLKIVLTVSIGAFRWKVVFSRRTIILKLLLEFEHFFWRLDRKLSVVKTVSYLYIGTFLEKIVFLSWKTIGWELLSEIER